MKHVKLFEQFISEALTSKTPNDVTTVEVDMAYDESDKDEMKAVNASWKKFNLKVKEIKGGQGGEHDITGKKKDILAYLQSDFYEMDSDTIKEYYPELLEGSGLKEYTLFNFSLNEGLDPDVAKAVLKQIANKEFTSTIFLSLDDRDQVKRAAGGKRLTGAPGPESGVRFTTLLNALGKGEFYTDGTDLVKGNKTLVDTKMLKTFGDLKKFVGGF